MTPEEEKEILESKPIGTWTILAIYGVLFALSWLWMWFRFISHGPVN